MLMIKPQNDRGQRIKKQTTRHTRNGNWRVPKAFARLQNGTRCNTKSWARQSKTKSIRMAADGLYTQQQQQQSQLHAPVRKRAQSNVKRVSLTLKRMAQICCEQNAPAAEDADGNAEFQQIRTGRFCSATARPYLVLLIRVVIAPRRISTKRINNKWNRKKSG